MTDKRSLLRKIDETASHAIAEFGRFSWQFATGYAEWQYRSTLGQTGKKIAEYTRGKNRIGSASYGYGFGFATGVAQDTVTGIFAFMNSDSNWTEASRNILIAKGIGNAASALLCTIPEGIRNSREPRVDGGSQ